MPGAPGAHRANVPSRGCFLCIYYHATPIFNQYFLSVSLFLTQGLFWRINGKNKPCEAKQKQNSKVSAEQFGVRRASNLAKSMTMLNCVVVPRMNNVLVPLVLLGGQGFQEYTAWVVATNVHAVHMHSKVLLPMIQSCGAGGMMHIQ